MKKFMTHKEMNKRFLMLLSPDNVGVIFGINRWNTEEMLSG